MKPPAPQGQAGPSAAPKKGTYQITTPDLPAPKSAAGAPKSNAGENQFLQPGTTPAPDLAPNVGSDPQYFISEDPVKPTEHMQELKGTPLPEIPTPSDKESGFRDLYSNPIPEKNGLEELDAKEFQPVKENFKPYVVEGDTAT